MRLLPVVWALLASQLLFLIPPNESYAFGPPAHKGILEKALDLLQANDNYCATLWPSVAERGAMTTYPDDAVYYMGQSLVWELPNSLNSVEHYFDPRNPDLGNDVPGCSATAGPWTIRGREKFELPPPFDTLPNESAYAIVYYIARGETRDFYAYFKEEYLKEPVPNKPEVTGTDGDGYNAVSAILFYLNGRTDEDNTNPSSLAPHDGFVKLASEGSFYDAFIDLGAAIHCVEDLFSPGHTEWKSWWQLASFEGVPTFVFSHPDHGDFDKLGDEFFEETEKLRILEDRLESAAPPLILSFSDEPERCLVKGGKNLPGLAAESDLWGTDLGAVLRQAASRSRTMWDSARENPDNAWDKDNQRFHRKYIENFAQHMADAVIVCAGVIDWAFSSAATTDGPYKRDATNFFGIAAAYQKYTDQTIVVNPTTLSGKDCYLGGIDQDDYFPISGNKFRYVRVNWENDDVAQGKLKAEAFDCNGNLLGRSRVTKRNLEVDLGEKAPQELLLRVYCPAGDPFKYTVAFTDQTLFPGPEGILDLVFCIDCSGSMLDDITAVKESSKLIIDTLTWYCSQNGISLQIGLVTYTRPTDAQDFAGLPEAHWLLAQGLIADSARIRQSILDILIRDPSIGKGGNEDIYAALMCAMDARADGDGNPVHMGWRHGAAKIIIAMGDEPPDDPNADGFTLQTVVDTAAALDPVHMYPLVLQNELLAFVDPAARFFRRLAELTGGKAAFVRSPAQLPQAIIDTVKTAIAEHREEVWRKAHPPLRFLGIALAVAGFVLMLAAVAWRRGLRPAASPARLRRFWLEAHLPDGRTIEALVNQPVFRIGSAATNELILDDSTVQPEHAEIRMDKGQAKLVSRGEEALIRVRGEMARERFLQSGDHILIGSTSLIWRVRSVQPVSWQSAVAGGMIVAALIGLIVWLLLGMPGITPTERFEERMISLQPSALMPPLPSSPATTISATGIVDYKPDELMELYQDRIVRIDNPSSLISEIIGSGIVLVNDETHALLLTNRHIVDPSFDPLLSADLRHAAPEAVLVRNPNMKEPVPVKVAAIARHNVDLAILLATVQQWKPESIPVARFRGLRPGEAAVAIGCPMGLDYSITDGVISRLDQESGLIQTSCPIVRGIVAGRSS